MAFNLLAMASTILQPRSDGLQPTSATRDTLHSQGRITYPRMFPLASSVLVCWVELRRVLRSAAMASR